MMVLLLIPSGACTDESSTSNSPGLTFESIKIVGSESESTEPQDSIPAVVVKPSDSSVVLQSVSTTPSPSTVGAPVPSSLPSSTGPSLPSQRETEPPLIGGIEVEPGRVSPEEEVVISFSISDASGLSWVALRINGPNLSVGIPGCPSGSGLRAANGTQFNGLYRYRCVIPARGIRSGSYVVSVGATDLWGNESWKNAPLEVFNGETDLQGPQVSGVRFEPPMPLSGQAVTLTFVVTDSSGVVYTTAIFRGLVGCGGRELFPISKSATEARFSMTCDLTGVPPGSIKVDIGTVDGARNESWSSNILQVS